MSPACAPPVLPHRVLRVEAGGRDTVSRRVRTTPRLCMILASIGRDSRRYAARRMCAAVALGNQRGDHRCRSAEQGAFAR